MDVSITSDMFNYHFKPGMERKLQLFAEHGFGYIHWCDDWDNDLIYTREEMVTYSMLIESAGLECLDVHGTATGTIRIDSEDNGAFETYIKLLENRIEFCYTVGGDAVVIHPPRYGGSELSWRIDRSTKVIDAVRPLCADLGVAIAVENCHPSDENILKTYFERYPTEYVGFCFDSGHANLNGNMDRLLKFNDRLKVLHLHDNKGERDDHQPPLSGTVNWSQVMGWIKESGYAKPINFEVTHDPDLFEGTMDEFLDYTRNSILKVMALLD